MGKEYAGYMYDKEIGMYYRMARYYNPDHGVFLSVDPEPGDEDDPVTMNGYTYGDNNPVMMVDPDGHVAWWVGSAAISAGFEVGKYLYKNKGYTWKGGLKAAGYGAVKGVAFGGLGRTFGFISPLKGLGRGVFQKRSFTPAIRQGISNTKRLMNNPRKHIQRNPGVRLDGMKRAKKQREKAFKNSTTAKLMKISNAVGKRR
ncbi:RHS repeat-associated core domain-containing protein [Bacillus sp. FSL E2-8887]|uniref:RHS repeat-associated core domain-containing protein n=1 Tax=Bacillus sp. FSL E2-8887 TaxID=2954599 RepID=UPI0030FC0C02